MHGARLVGRRGEQGTTMVELLVAVAILGVAFVSILGGMATSITASDIHRKQADGLALVTRNAEAVKAAPYVACAGPAAYEAALSVASGYSVSVTAVAFLDGAGFVTTCTTDPGIQRVSLEAKATSGTEGVETVDVIKRKP